MNEKERIGNFACRDWRIVTLASEVIFINLML